MNLPSLVCLAALALPSTGRAATSSDEVRWEGTLHAVHGGDGSAHVDLKSLEPKVHLYALGPIARFDGEITVLDGKAHLVRVGNGGLVTTHDFSAAASFLVWTRVERWSPPTALSRGPGDPRDLDRLVEDAAVRAGVDTSRPFPFLLEGAFTSVDLHVMTPPGPTAPAAGSHGGGVPRKIHLAEVRGTALGFFSRKHEGVFTHRGSATHVHLVASDGRSGHVDELRPGPDVAIAFPAR